MADLQSFFAKKDKKKKSKKPETFTPDDLMKKIEQVRHAYSQHHIQIQYTIEHASDSLRCGTLCSDSL